MSLHASTNIHICLITVRLYTWSEPKALVARCRPGYDPVRSQWPLLSSLIPSGATQINENKHTHTHVCVSIVFILSFFNTLHLKWTLKQTFLPLIKTLFICLLSVFLLTIIWFLNCRWFQIFRYCTFDVCKTWRTHKYTVYIDNTTGKRLLCLFVF